MRTMTLDVPDELADQLGPLRDRLTEMLALSLQQPAVPAQLYRAILTFPASAPTREQIVAFVPPPEVRERLRTLLDREQSDALTSAERAEADELERIEHLVIMLKIGALSTLTAEA